MSFTPGPWKVTNWNGGTMSVDSPSWLICDMNTTNLDKARAFGDQELVDKEYALVKANASLVAAAPDLLETLMRIRYVIKTGDGDLLGALAQADEVIVRATA